MDSAGQEEGRQGLEMSSAEKAPGAERRTAGPGGAWKFPVSFYDLRTPHEFILMVGRVHMPIFEYICKECHHQFEALVYGKEKAECPKCHAKKLEPQLSVFAVSAKSSSTSAAPAGGCGRCGDPRGPGACSMGDMN